MRAVAAVALFVGVFAIGGLIHPAPAAAQHRMGAAAGSGASTTATHAGPSKASRAATSHRGTTHGAFPSRTSPAANPLTTPFPNISTLSGPLPGTFASPRPNDLYRVHGRFNTGPSYFPGIAYGASVDENAPAAESPAPPPQPATGTLRIDATPLSAQVFVDGYYAGTVDDIQKRRGLQLAEGPHRLELRARGYVSDELNIAVPAHDVVTYRGALDAEQPAAPRVAPTAAAATMYVIPGCYVGNVPPRKDRVGSGCDVSKVQVIPPSSLNGPARSTKGH